MPKPNYNESMVNNFTPLKTAIEITENKGNVSNSVNNPEKPEDKTASIINEDYIKHKKIYKRFLKQIKDKTAVNGVIMADILGVTRQTIYKWLDTPSALTILNDNIFELTNKIKNSKDWKASAYLIDKLYNKQDVTNIQVNTLDGLTIIRR